tara:strand:+ start:90 stop:251 length:162 start_codon:yes stop_codon:yes gene_type:complete
MEAETFRFFLLAVFIPFAGYKIFRLYRKLFNLSKPSIRDQLEITFKKNSNFID